MDPNWAPKNRAEIADAASELLRVLSNPKRLLILCYLADGELSVQQLQVATGLGQSTVSQQLAIMRGEKLVTARREAQSVYYSLESAEARKVIETLQSIYVPDPAMLKEMAFSS
ncbi:ArsR/SmtB family transcription factor [Sinisalibacter aestuarii]|uniref:Transcriptional regulator n=1 Tax=Sinisalibacter aestuarii TaxID=2949426 RepID=A0ABQ5LN01_9RHOB|nr:metalloregulator ArsR/SmtB family transcription factor [Sinisalibacter aestuarii]GKY86389.1 transcriptional regulator [Sinisalibacter aestuarii]